MIGAALGGTFSAVYRKRYQYQDFSIWQGHGNGLDYC